MRNNEYEHQSDSLLRIEVNGLNSGIAGLSNFRC